MADIVIQLLPHILAALLYGALGFHFWNTRWRESETQCVACPMQAWERSAIAAALIIHASGLYVALFSEAGMRFSFSFALSLMMWLAVLIYWLESFMSRMEGMQPMVLPLAAVCAALPVVFPQVHLVAHASATGFKLHFLAAMLAYSLLTLSALTRHFHGLYRKRPAQALIEAPPEQPATATHHGILAVPHVAGWVHSAHIDRW
jgi:ABC-type uncharacterized transport system permease subunit